MSGLKKRSALITIVMTIISLSSFVLPSPAEATVPKKEASFTSLPPCNVTAKSPNINVRKEPTTKSQVVSVMQRGDRWAAYCGTLKGENVAICSLPAHDDWVRLVIGYVHKSCVYWIE